MKRKVHLLNYFMLVLVVVLNFSTLLAQEIVYVYDPGRIDAITGENPDIPTIRLLEENGYTVHHFTTLALSSATPEQIDSLNSADLIFIGRAVGSTNFESPNKELWNAISAPIITQNMWALRSNRMNWFNSADCANIDVPLDEVFQGEIWTDDPVFEGLSGITDWWTGPYSTINVTDAGNGEVLATKTGDNYVLFARFESFVEFYDGSVDMPEGQRVYFGSASDNMLDEEGNNIFNYLGFTEGIKKVFLNEIANLTGIFEPVNTGFNRKNMLESLSVYPIPASTTLNIEMTNLKNVDVIAFSGKVVASVLAQGSKTVIDLSGLKKGVYYLKISDINNDNVIKKVLVE